MRTSIDTEVLPKVAVLLATYNGSPYLREQLDSILAQQGVKVHIYVSDDQSRDATRRILEQYRDETLCFTLFSPSQRLGSAGRNFYYLFEQTRGALSNFDFVALADQDDIWLGDKLESAIKELNDSQAAGLSSDVEAFWEHNNTRKVLRKSQPQKQYDYLFESPGPGCSFVLRRELFQAFQERLVRAYPKLSAEVIYHDWLIYAFARSCGEKWLISNSPKMLYRQHGANELGANSGWNALRHRLEFITSGLYRAQINAIAQFCGCEEDSKLLNNYWRRFAFVPQSRRKLSGRFIIAAIFLLGLY